MSCLPMPGRPVTLVRAVRLALFGLPLVAGLQGYSPHALADDAAESAETLDRVTVVGQKQTYQVQRTSTAVSYTHLDVYKRQVQGRHEPAFGNGVSAIADCLARRLLD